MNGLPPATPSQSPLDEPLWKRLWRRAKLSWDLIKVCRTLLALVTALMVMVNGYLVRSSLLRSVIIVFGSVGVAAGYFVTMGLWQGVSLEYRRRLAWRFIVG